MKKKIILFICITVIFLLLGYVFFKSQSPLKQEEATFSPSEKKPPRVVNYGPYGTNVDFTENIGQAVLHVHADKLYVIKGKIMFFDNALHKKLRADNMTVTLFHQNNKILSFHKQYLILPLKMNVINVPSPKILYPGTIKHADSIIVDKNKQTVTIRYNDKTDVWHLDSLDDRI